MLILSIDTSTTVCSVALHQGDTGALAPVTSLLGCYELFTERTSSARLTTLIQDLVEHTGHQLSDLDAVAVAKGPGSYTGLRIGVSTAKGLCYALDKPLIAINTLEAMAAQIRPYFTSHTLLCPMIDARRMEVYTAFYEADGGEMRPPAAVVVEENSFSDLLAAYPIVFFGDGAAKCKPLLQYHPNALFPDLTVRPSARTVGELAVEAFGAGQFEDVALFEPFYLKDFVGTRPRTPVV